jgi:hypothetical protein
LYAGDLEGVILTACNADLSKATWDRCYDFLNIFAETFSEKIGVFDSQQRPILNKLDRNIGI